MNHRPGHFVLCHFSFVNSFRGLQFIVFMVIIIISNTNDCYLYVLLFFIILLLLLLLLILGLVGQAQAIS